ncbi:hypothetical protein [Paenisporosarcina sp.]|uniref:hypothetical protein n=1 Tax=Paenisporosarcina sp. TaxID=1932001 RepID=UPI003C70D530
MKKKSIILLVILFLLAMLFLVSSLWSIIGLLVAGLGVFHYLKNNKGKSSIKRPLLVIWSGILLAFIIVIVNTDSDTGVANETDVKLSTIENDKAKEDAKIAAEAKAKEDAKIAAEAKAKEDAKVAAEAEAKEDAKIAAEAKAKAKEDAKVAAAAKAKEDAKIAAAAKAKEDAKVAAAEQARIAKEAEAQEAAEAEQASSSNLLYDPFGSDKNCSDFPGGGAEAQEFYIAAGGPESDPHDLDRDNDGNACDWD